MFELWETNCYVLALRTFSNVLCLLTVANRSNQGTKLVVVNIVCIHIGAETVPIYSCSKKVVLFLYIFFYQLYF